MTTTSSTNPTASATSQILTSLNSGSGIDKPNLVSSLVAAQYAVKRDQLSARSDALTTQISYAVFCLQKKKPHPLYKIPGVMSTYKCTSPSPADRKLIYPIYISVYAY